ncbi:methionyl-tRNA formyltransferase [Candidatus Wolfebacteria bacterium]|nr:methionyl-tRNA formyltransferase [Candidatus Wolfebacteria bacterium]
MKSNCKIVFLGNPEFSIPTLENLIKNNYQIIAIITSPDKPVGRKKIITPSPLKVFAFKKNLPIFQPVDKTEMFELLEKLQPDLGIVAAFGMILPEKILNIPKYGFINIHPSLLPRWRGATPIQNTILYGDEKTGVTLYLMDEKTDHGPIIAQQELNNYESEIVNYKDLSQKLAELGGNLLIKTLPKFLNNEITLLPQEETKAINTKKILIEDAFIKLSDLEIAQKQGGEKAIEINRKIKALNPEPGPWTVWQGEKPFNFVKNKRMKLLESEINECGKLNLKKIQFEGKNPISYN